MAELLAENRSLRARVAELEGLVRMFRQELRPARKPPQAGILERWFGRCACRNGKRSA